MLYQTINERAPRAHEPLEMAWEREQEERQSQQDERAPQEASYALDIAQAVRLFGLSWTLEQVALAVAESEKTKNIRFQEHSGGSSSWISAEPYRQAYESGEMGNSSVDFDEF